MALEQQHSEQLEPTGPAPQPIDRLSFIRPRENRPMDAARHSRWVFRLRWMLPLGAMLVLVALIVWPMVTPAKIVAIAMKNIPDLAIDNLHFTGMDTKNEPYSMNAVKATRPQGMHNIYDLDKPQAEITLTNGTWVEGQAQYGRYDQDTRRLWLGGNVQLFQDKGMQFTSDEAQVDMNENNAWGEKPVLIQGGFGEIRGQGFRMLDSGKVMIVTGPAHATLDLHSRDASDKPAPTAR